MKPKKESIIEKVLTKAREKGNIQAEVYYLDSREMTIEVAYAKVENMKIAEERGIGLRVLIGNRMGYAYSSDLTSSALNKMVESAVLNAYESEPDPNLGLPLASNKYPEVSTYHEKTFQIPINDKINLAMNIEEAARTYDPRVMITEKAVYQDSLYNVAIFNTFGVAQQYQGSYCGGYVMVVGVENEERQMGFGMQYEIAYDQLDPAKIGKNAGQKAVRMLGAQTISSARLPVILEPYTATQFLGILEKAFSAEAVLKGRSFLKDKERKKVASSLITIIDDGTLKGRIGSAPSDGEGIATSKTTLIKDGILEGYLHNTYTAKKMNLLSTGNGIRGTYKGVPEVGPTNFYIQQGNDAPQSLLQNISQGLYITDLMGMHTANPISGDFSVGAAGLLIEKGQLTRPFKGVALAGNIKDLFLQVDGIGNDLTFFVGKGAPTIRIEELSISGT